MQNYQEFIILRYQYFRRFVNNLIITYLPITQKLDRFQNFLLLNILLFVFCWFVGFIHSLQITKKLAPKNISASFARFAVKYLPFVKNKMISDLERLESEVLKQFKPQQRSAIKKLPRKPVDVSTVKNQNQIQTLDGYHSGTRYANKSHGQFVANLAANFIYSNPLHYDLHPQIRQMQTQTIKMTAKMLNFTQNGEPIGVFTSGGTQSILLAILSFRQYGRSKGITKPNLVLCQTAHVASLKACYYFQIEARIVKYDENYKMSVSDMKKNIDSNTVGVYTSYPNYPYGTVDPVQEIGAYCKRKDIPVHIDMCLGGFVVPFLKNKQGKPMLPTIPQGISTISVDPHKYGMSGKGASILLYSSSELRRYQFFASSNWQGGLYGTIGLAGSRSGAGIASAWVSMMRLGQTSYKQSAQKIQQGVIRITKALRQSGYTVYGQPEICVIAFSHPKYPINAIMQILKKKWTFSLLQKPFALHFSFTPMNITKIDEMIKDVKDCAQQLKNSNKVYKDSGQIQLYCTCAKIPDHMIQNEVMATLLDCYIDI